MVEEVILDSSVLVSALVEGEEFRPIARSIMEKIFLGKYRAVTSSIVFVEVCGSVSRRVGVDMAILVNNQLNRWEEMGLISFSEFTGKRREEAVGLAVQLKLKGMDAVVVQVARERNGVLITFDQEMAEKAKAAVRVLTYTDFSG